MNKDLQKIPDQRIWSLFERIISKRIEREEFIDKEMIVEDLQEAIFIVNIYNLMISDLLKEKP